MADIVHSDLVLLQLCEEESSPVLQDVVAGPVPPVQQRNICRCITYPAGLKRDALLMYKEVMSTSRYA